MHELVGAGLDRHDGPGEFEADLVEVIVDRAEGTALGDARRDLEASVEVLGGEGVAPLDLGVDRIDTLIQLAVTAVDGALLVVVAVLWFVGRHTAELGVTGLPPVAERFVLAVVVDITVDDLASSISPTGLAILADAVVREVEAGAVTVTDIDGAVDAVVAVNVFGTPSIDAALVLAALLPAAAEIVHRPPSAAPRRFTEIESAVDAVVAVDIFCAATVDTAALEVTGLTVIAERIFGSVSALSCLAGVEGAGDTVIAVGAGLAIVLVADRFCAGPTHHQGDHDDEKPGIHVITTGCLSGFPPHGLLTPVTSKS